MPADPIQFDRDTLTLRRGKKLLVKLAEIETRESEFTVFEEGPEFEDAIEDAAWEVFAGHRSSRSILWGACEITGADPVTFDMKSTLAAGCRLDWRAGVIHPPNSEDKARRVIPLHELTPEPDDRAELIRDRYLCRGGAVIIPGPTGIGKSSLSMQMAIAFALGRTVFGLTPARPLSSLIVQAENDNEDLCEMRDGMLRGMGLDAFDLSAIGQMVSVATIDDAVGHEFGMRLLDRIRQWQPDLAFIDPLLAFAGGDIGKQEVASAFLRGVLTPLMHRTMVGLVILHHTGKPPREGNDRETDYLGLGSSELSNWPRAIASLTRTKTPGVFALTLGKRGGRAQWVDAAGARTFTRLIRHAAQGIHWEECDPSEEVTRAIASAPTKDSVLGMVPLDKPIGKKVLLSKAQTAGIGLNKAEGYISELLAEERLHLWLVPRPKTNPERMLARIPQPDQSQPELPDTKS